MSEEIKTFSERIAELMEIRHLTKAEFAREAGISKATVTRYLQGQFKAKQDTIYDIAQQMRINPAWLLGYDVPLVGDFVEEPAASNDSKVPLLGGAAGGIGYDMPILEDIEKPAFVNADCAFVVRGESMASCGIHTDDIVYIKRGIYQDGTIHCVRTPDGYVLKKLYRSNNGFMLLSDIEPIIVDGEQTDYEVVGKAVYKLQAI